MKNKKRIKILEEQVRMLMSCSGNVSKTESELTELPEKWCVRHSDETLNWIRKNAKYSGESIPTALFYYFPENRSGNNYKQFDFPKGYTEITLDQFKKWVLKEDKKKGSS